MLTDNNKIVLWQSNTPNSNLDCRIELQDDGNLVIFNNEQDVAVWASETNSIQSLRLDKDGVLRGYDADSAVAWFSHYSAVELAGFQHDARESTERANQFMQQKDQATPRFLAHISRVNPTQTKEIAMGWRRLITCYGTNGNVTYVHVYKSGGSAAEQLSYTGCQQAATNEKKSTAKNIGVVIGTLATFVRDPIDRFYSAVAEIYAAGLDQPEWRWNPDPDSPETWVREMIASIQRMKWLWNEHMMPQHIFLRHNNGTKLPMAFVGSMASYNRDLKALYGKVGAIHTPTIKVVHGPLQTKYAEILRGTKPLIRKVSEDDLLFLCKMYYEDYVAFDLTPPDGCRSLFLSKNQKIEDH